MFSRGWAGKEHNAFKAGDFEHRSRRKVSFKPYMLAVVLLLDSIFNIHLSMQYSSYFNFVMTEFSVE